jgi:acetyl-CoA carboxylase biotin carboxyl carrier protein
MTLDEIKHLIEFIREQELAEFDLEHDGTKIRIRSGASASVPLAPVIVTAPPPSAPLVSVAPGTPAASQATGPASAAAAPAPEDGPELAIVKSPIVGTFYRSPDPGAKPFIDVGDTVKKGDVLCIIEAMKLMNEIDSEYDGEVVNVYVESGQAVQYGERLFAIRLK